MRELVLPKCPECQEHDDDCCCPTDEELKQIGVTGYEKWSIGLLRNKRDKLERRVRKGKMSKEEILAFVRLRAEWYRRLRSGETTAKPPVRLNIRQGAAA